MAPLAWWASESTRLFWTFLIIILTCNINPSIISAGPSDPTRLSKCVPFCKGSSRFGYDPGQTYIYDYKTSIVTSTLGTSSPTGSLIQVLAQAEISAITGCELSLQLKNIRFEEGDIEVPENKFPVLNSDELIQELGRRPLRFSFQDGHIEHLCSSEDEPVWVLNFKRGLLSTLQVTMENLNFEESKTETDVIGKCATRYEGSEDGTIIYKSKDLRDCTDRNSYMSTLESLGSSPNAQTQGLPLVRGGVSCTQVLQNKIIQKVECKEENIFKPFDNHEGGAKTTVTQDLVYVSKMVASGETHDIRKLKKESLIFQAADQSSSGSQSSRMGTILELMDKLEIASVPNVRIESPDLFVEIVEELRLLDYLTLKAVYSTLSTSSKGNMFIDSMAFVSTAASQAFMRDLYQEGKLSEAQVDAWLTSLAFIRNPTLEMFSSLEPLLDTDIQQKAILGISALIHSFCRGKEDCLENTPAIQTIISKIMERLGETCTASSPQQELQIIVGLKALGNAGILSLSDIKKVERCSIGGSSSLEVRLAGIDAFRRVPCDSYNRKTFVSMFADPKEDTEVRIQAYLAIMKCPTREFIDAVKETLYKDSVNQVGSFVWTHLTNLQETQTPEKQALRELLQNDFLRDKFQTDARKFSRNYEGSMFWDELNLGAGLDGNLIFSPESFIPRSGMLNLTVHLFGESINLAEFGGRIHSLERLLEPIFGPQGFLPDETISEALRSSRNRRDVQGLGELYNQVTRKDRDEVPELSYYTRVLGNELSYKSIELNHEPKDLIPATFSGDGSGLNWFQLADIFRKYTNGKDIEYLKSTILLDTKFDVPTSAGLPLSLSILSAGTVGLNARGNLNLDSFWEKKELDIEGRLRPSATIKVKSTMGVWLGNSRSNRIHSALRLENILHSSTSVEGHLIMKGTKLIRTSISFPDNKQELFEARSQIIKIRPSGKTGAPQTLEGQNFKTCTPVSFSTLTGVQLCAEGHLGGDSWIPNLLTSAALHVHMKKTDTFKSYDFEYKWMEEGERTYLNLLFNTPGSKVNRRISGDFLLDKPLGKFEIAIDVLGSSIQGEGKYTNTSKNLQLTLTYGQNQVLHFSSGLMEEGGRISPHILISTYNRPVFEVKGVIDMKDNFTNTTGKASYELSLSHVTQSPIIMKGEVGRKDETFTAEANIQSFLLTALLRSQILNGRDIMGTKTELTYSWKHFKPQTIDLNWKIQKIRRGALSRYSMSGSLTNSGTPDMNTNLSLDTQVTRGFCETNAQLTVGKFNWNGKTLYSSQNVRGRNKLQFLASLEAPKLGIEYGVDLSHELTKWGFYTKGSLRNSPKSELKGTLEYFTERKLMIKQSVGASLSWPGQMYSLKTSLSEGRRGDLLGEFLLNHNSNEEKKAYFTFKNLSNQRRFEYELIWNVRGFLQEALNGEARTITREGLVKFITQIEVSGPNGQGSSGKWGLEFEYSSIPRNTKVEGKVDLNGAVYSAEINYFRFSSGRKTLYLDLKGSQNLYIKGELRPYAHRVVTSLYIYPDRNSQPNHEIACFGIFSPAMVEVKIKYFGTPYEITASIRGDRYHLRVQWSEFETVSLFVTLMDPEWDYSHFTVTLWTPWEGYGHQFFRVNHSLFRSQYRFRIDGSLQDYYWDFHGEALPKDKEGSFETSLNITGLPFLELKGKGRRGRDSDDWYTSKRTGEGVISGELSATIGDISSNLSLVHAEDYKGVDIKMEFESGFSIPKVSVSFLNEGWDDRIQRFAKVQPKMELQVQWAPLGSSPNHFEIQVLGTPKQLNYTFMIKTPWDQLRGLDGSLYLENKEGFRELLFVLNGDEGLSYLPLEINLTTSGGHSEFNHEGGISWTENGDFKRIRGLAKGSIKSLVASDMKLTLEALQEKYEIALSSIKAEGEYKAQADFNGTRGQGAIGLKSTHKSDNIDLSAWTQVGNGPKYSVDLVTQRNSSLFNVKASGQIGSNSVGKFSFDLMSRDFSNWNLTCSTETSLNFLPTISASIHHSVKNLSQFQHSTEVSITRTNPKNLGGYTTSKFILNMKVAGEELQGLLHANGREVGIQGRISVQEETKSMDFQISSNAFETLKGKGIVSWEKGGQSILITMDKSDANLLELKAKTLKENQSYRTEFEIKCSLDHHIQFTSLIDLKGKHLDITFNETSQDLFNFGLIAEAKSNEGTLQIKMGNKFVLSFGNFDLDTSYKFEPKKFTFSTIYKNMDGERSVKIELLTEDSRKNLDINYIGAEKFSLNMFLQNPKDRTTIGASVIQDLNQVFETELVYNRQMDEFELGKHSFDLSINLHRVEYEFNWVIGLGRHHLLSSLRTPIIGWKKVLITGRLDEGDASLRMEKEGQEYSAQLHWGQIAKNLSIVIRTPISGYTMFGGTLEFSSGQNVAGVLRLFVEKDFIEIRGSGSISGLKLRVESPFEAMRQAFLNVGLNLGESKKSFKLSAGLNDEEYQLDGELKTESGTRSILLTSAEPNVYEIGGMFEVKDGFKASAFLQTKDGRKEIFTQLLIGEKEVRFDLKTPFTGYEKIFGKVEYKEGLTQGHHKFYLEWDLGGRGAGVTLEITHNRNGIEVQIGDLVKGKMLYKLESPSKKLEFLIQIEEEQVLEITLDSTIKGNFLQFQKAASISAQFRAQGLWIPFDELSAQLEYNRAPSNHEHSLELTFIKDKSKNYLGVKGKVAEGLELTGELDFPSFGFQQKRLEISGGINGDGNGRLVAQFHQNGQVHELQGNWSHSPSKTEVIIETSFPLIKRIHVSWEWRSDGKIRALAQLNQRKLELKGQILGVGLKNTKINMELITPLHGFKSVQVEVDLKLLPTNVVGRVRLQNDLYRYMGKLDGSWSEEDGLLFRLGLNSPIREYENILGTFGWGQPGLTLKLERNTVEELNLNFGLATDKIHFSIISHPFQIKIKGQAQLSSTGNLELTTNFNGYAHFRIQWSLDLNPSGWKARASYDIVGFGQTALRTAWKSDQGKGISFDLWLDPGNGGTEKGLNLEYSLASNQKGGLGKLGVSLTYVLDKTAEKVAISTAIRRAHPTNSVEITLNTPFQSLKNVTISAKVVLDPEVSIELTGSHNQKRLLSAIVYLFVSPLASRLKLNLNAPILIQPFNFNAAYNMSGSDKELSLLFTQGQYRLNVKTSAVIPKSSEEIELRLSVESNVPSVKISASGSLKASYKIDSQNVRELSVSIYSEHTGKWSIQGSIRPTVDFLAKFVLESPIPHKIPSINFQLLLFPIDDQPHSFSLKIGKAPELRGSLKTEDHKFHAALVSGVQGLENVIIQGGLNSGSGYLNKSLVLQAIVRNQIVISLEGYLQSLTPGSETKGSITIMSSTPLLTNCSLSIVVHPSGSVQVIGTLGPSTLEILGNIKGQNGLSLLQGAKTDLSLALNSVEQFKIQSSHHFKDPKWSLNVSVGSYYKLSTTLTKVKRQNFLNGSIRFGEDTIFLNGSTSPGNFQVLVKTPWTHDLTIQGNVSVTPKVQSANVLITYNQKESRVSTHIESTKDSFNSELILDVPVLNQKLDAKVLIQKPNLNNLTGSIEMRMMDRQIGVKGSLTTTAAKGHEEIQGRLENKHIQITVTLPSTDIPQISGSLLIQRPQGSLESARIEASIDLPGGTTTAAINYQLPGKGSKGYNLEILLDGSLIHEEPLAFSIQSDHWALDNFSGELRYNSDRVRVSWDSRSKFALESFANLPSIFPGSNPMHLAMEWVLNIPTEARGLLTVSYGNAISTLEGFILKDSNSYLAELHVQVPEFIMKKRQILFKLEEVQPGRNRFEVSSIEGAQNIEVTGEILISNHSTSISLKSSGGLGAHFLHFQISKMEPSTYMVELSVESFTLLRGKKLIVSGKYAIKYSGGIDAVLECKSRGKVHTMSIDSNLNNLTLQVKSPALSPISLVTKWKFDNEASHIWTELTIGQTTHGLELHLNTKDFEAQLTANSPFIPYKKFNVQGKVIHGNSHLEVLGDVDVGGTHWRIEGVVKHRDAEEVMGKLELITPWEDFHRFTLEGRLALDEIRFELYTPFKDFPNAVLGLSGISFNDPPTLRNFKPKLIVGFPWRTYSASALAQLPEADLPGRFNINLDFGHRYELFLDCSPLDNFKIWTKEPLQVKLDLVTPVKGLEKYELAFGWSLTIQPSWSELSLRTNINGTKTQFLTQLRNTEDEKRILIELITPISTFERLSFQARLEDFGKIGSGHVIQIDLESPAWSTPVHMEVNWTFKHSGLLKTEGEIMISIPSSQEVLPVALEWKSGVMESIYSGEIKGSWGSQRPFIKIKSGILEGRLFGNIEGKAGEGHPYQTLAKFEISKQDSDFFTNTEMQLNYERVVYSLLSFSLKPNGVEAQFELVTPFHWLSSLTAECRVSPISEVHKFSVQRFLGDLELKFGASYNREKLIQFELTNRNGRRSIEIHNLVQPVSIILTLDRSSVGTMEAVAEYCWDLESPQTSTIGLGFSLKNMNNGNFFRFKIQGGTYGGLGLGMFYDRTSEKLEHGFGLKLNMDESTPEIGYSFSLKQIGSAQSLRLLLNLPTRSVETTLKYFNKPEDSEVSMKIRWDVVREPTKIVGLTLADSRAMRKDKVKVQKSLSLMHSGLANELKCVLANTYIGDKVQSREFSIIPNSFPQDTFHFRVSNEDSETHVTIAHPSTNSLFNSVFKMTDSTVSLDLSHQDIYGVNQCLEIMFVGVADRANLQIQGGPQSKMIMVLVIDLKTGSDEQILKITTPEFEIKAIFQESLPLLTTTIKYDAGIREIQFIAGLPHKKELTVKLLRSEHGITKRDLNGVLRLNASEMLSTRLEWRPELANELSALGSLPAQIKMTILNDLNRAKRFFNQETGERLKVLDPSLVRMLNTLNSYTQKEMESLWKEWAQVFNYLENLDAGDTFILKDAVGIIRGIALVFRTITETTMGFFKSGINSAVRFVSLGVERLIDTLRDSAGHFEDFIMPAWDNFDNAVARSWERWSNKFYKLLEFYSKLYNSIVAKIIENVKIFETTIFGPESWNQITQLYEDYSGWLQWLPIQDYIDDMKRSLESRFLEPWAPYYKLYMEAFNEAIQSGDVASLLDAPPIPLLVHLSSRFNIVVNKIWKLVQAEQMIKELIRQILHRVDTIMQRHIPTTSMVWDPVKGHLEYHQPLTFFEWEDFSQSPKWRIPEEDAYDAHEINDIYYDLMDKINEAQPYLDLNLRELLPPYQSHAIMAGDNHYYTFDKKYYRFTGDCSYVLVADLLHQNFTLLVNYDIQDGVSKKKSYSLVSEAGNIEIDAQNFNVILDGKKAELPLVLGPTFVRRQPGAVELFDKRGFNLICAQSPSVCAISVSGWYFGKLGGLLGTYDNEPMNDFKSPDGQILGDPTSFAHSWRVGGNNGKCRDTALEDEMGIEQSDETCKALFTSKESQLRPCFNRVNPEAFMRMCQFDVARNKNSARRAESPCLSVHAYAAECRAQNVDVWVPSMCVRCDLENGGLIESGENITVESDGPNKPPKSGDVVILIEESSSLKPFKLNELVQYLDVALNGNRLVNNRYTVIGFGGGSPKREPHIITFSGQVWSHSTLVKLSDGVPMDGDGTGDFYDAITYALSFGFRAGVSKTLIGIVADGERCGSEERYADALTLLQENDLRLHLLAPLDFTMKGNKRKDNGSKIFGIDIDGVYSSSTSTNTMESDKSLKRFLNIPKDMCTPLALETSGTRFNLNHMRLRTPRKFLDVWSRRVAQSGIPSPCQICECISERDGGAVTHCHQCISPSLKVFLDEWEKFTMNGEAEIESGSGMIPENL